MINRRHRVEGSESILAVGYDPEEQAMEVTFSQGKTYRYEKIHPNIFAALMNAESVGTHFAKSIKNTFKGRPIEIDLKKASKR